MGNKYFHLSIEERATIQVALNQGQGIRSIAEMLMRNPSTISRELKRNGWSHPPTPSPRARGRPALVKGYSADAANQRARICITKPRCEPRLKEVHPLWEHIEPLMRERHSPEQIAGMLKRKYPDQKELHVSHETIYTALYALPRGSLRKDLLNCLRHSRQKRRPRSRGQDRRGTLVDMVSIHDRPPEVNDRLVPGHWGGDLIKGKGNASAVGTLVERKSLFVVLAKMKDTTSDTAVKSFANVLKRIDAQYKLTLTYDRGKEMAYHKLFTQKTGVKVYFADAHSPWQRGINENTNGLLREYLPKNVDLSIYSQKQLDNIAWALNTRVRKSLGWKCPAEIFMPGSFDFDKFYDHIVALGA